MSGVERTPRSILAKAYRDNGDLGAANYIAAGHDLLPDTQVHLLAIQDALEPTTPAQGLDAATIERCARLVEQRLELCQELASTAWHAVFTALPDAIRALNTASTTTRGEKNDG